MTEKRFTIDKERGVFYIFDNGTLLPINDGEPIVDLLNALHEENQAVKDVLIDLNKIDIYWDSALLQGYLDKIANILGVDLE